MLYLAHAGFATMCVDHINSPLAHARNKVEQSYTGPMDTELADSMLECDPDVGISHIQFNIHLLVKKGGH